MQDELVERVPRILRQLRVDRLGLRRDGPPLGQHAIGLMIVHKVERGRVDQFGLATPVVLGVPGDDVGDLGGMGRTEFALRPGPRVLSDPLLGPAGRVPRQGQKELDGKLHRLQIAHVDHPDAIRVVLPSEVHLLPDFGDRHRVEPFVVAWSADVIEVIVDARPAGTLPLLRGGQTPQVAPVVVAPEQNHVVGNAHPPLVVSLHLLVERPDLRHGRQIGIDFLCDDLPLLGDDLLQQSDVGLLRHRLVAIAPHGQRDDLLIVFGALDALCPERAQGLSVLGVVPTAPLVAEPLPLFPSPHHGLVVRRAHHDPVFIRKLRIQRIVGVERVVPHGRPEKVALHAEDQLEDLRIELVIVVAELPVHPAAQGRRLVVEKNAAILHRRRTFHVCARPDEQGLPACDRYIRPPVPGRDPDLFGQIVEAEDRAALVAAGDHQSVGNAWNRLWHDLNEKRFPLADDLRYIDLAIANQSLDDRAFADRAHEDHVRPEVGRLVCQLRGAARDAGDVRLQVLHGAHHTCMVVRIDTKHRQSVALRQAEAVLAWGKVYVRLLTNRQDHRGRRCGNEHP